MSHIARFRAAIREAPDAARAGEILVQHTTAFPISNEARLILIRIAASITRHMDADLFGHVLGGENHYADDDTLSYLLANRDIPDEDWENTIGDLLERGARVQGRGTQVSSLIRYLASADRLKAGGRVATLLRQGIGSNMGGLLGYQDPENLLLHFADEPPVQGHSEAHFVLHPLAAPEHWVSALDASHYPDSLVCTLLANPDTMAHPEVRQRVTAIAKDAVTKLSVGEVIDRIETHPDQTLFWTAAMLGQAGRVGKPTPPTFVKFIRGRLSQDDLAGLLQSADREVRLRALELVGRQEADAPGPSRRSPRR